MESVPGVRGRRPRGDRVNEEEVIGAYLREVRAFLHVDKECRSRVLEEIENHLRDGAATYISEGADPAQAALRMTRDLGAPRSVAAEFTAEAIPLRTQTGARRWSPMVLPCASLVLALILIVVSITWIPGGMTAGQRAAGPIYLKTSVVAAALTYGAHFSIRRADTDRAWRLAAWACTAATIAFLAT